MTNSRNNSPLFAIVLSVIVLLCAGFGIYALRHSESKIEIFAGGAGKGYGGDNGPAVKAGLSSPGLLCYGPNGHLYIDDAGNQAVREVDSNGAISTILRLNDQGIVLYGKRYRGEKILSIQGICIDKNATLYFSDRKAGKVFKISSNQIVRVAGNGKIGFSGDGASALHASLNNPLGVVTDQKGNLFIADSLNNKIRKVDAQGVITTIAGIGSAGVQGDNGPALKAELDFPSEIAVDSSGVIYISEKDNIRKIDQSGIITTLKQGGALTHIAVDNENNLYIVSFFKGNSITKIAKQGNVLAEYNPPGSSTLYPSTRGDTSKVQFVNISGISLDPKGNVYLSDSQMCAVFRLSGF